MTKQARLTLGSVGGVLIIVSLMMLVMVYWPTTKPTERVLATVEPALLQRPD